MDTGSEAMGVRSGEIAWCDYDRDGDIDLAMAGNYDDASGRFLLYRNDWPGPANTAPSPPTIDTGTYPPVVGGTVVGGKKAVTFYWLPGSDTETPEPLLTYSLRVWPSAGGNDVAPAMARIDNGRRFVARPGPVRAAASLCDWTVWLTVGVAYEWAVQTIDTGFLGSTWETSAETVTP